MLLAVTQDLGRIQMELVQPAMLIVTEPVRVMVLANVILDTAMMDSI
jgi:hypothetical protein